VPVPKATPEYAREAADISAGIAQHLTAAESRDYHERGYDGPHHLDQAAAVAGTNLETVQSALSGR
jgi:hypothetical protein